MAQAPKFWQKEDVGSIRKADIARAIEAGKAAGLKNVSNDKVKRIVVGIDYQVDFIRDDGTLKVEGALDDIARFTDFLYGQAENISAMLFTMDMHLPWQIFYGLWWRDRNGEHPAPLTMITEDDVKNGIWIPQLEKKWSEYYVTELAKTGQSPLIIWPEHCMVGSDGASLMPGLSEAVAYLAAARGIQPMYMFKGTVPQSEHYGPFCPCVPVPGHPQGGLQTKFMDIIAEYDEIIVAGEAEDFCVREGMRQLLKYYGARSDVIAKMRFLSDCTSLVFSDKRAEADNILDDYAAKGVRIVKSTEV